MSQIFNKMRIDVRQDIVDIITAKQNDSNSRFLDVFLYDGATPIDLTGEEVRIYMRKPDGTEIFNNGTITDAVNGRCEFELTSQALGAVGVLQCEISIWQDNTEILTTQTFHVFVTESLRSDGSVESSNEYGALVVLFQNLYESMDLMQDMVANFGISSEIASERGITTFWQAVEYVAQYMDTNLTEIIENALANASVSEVLNRIGTSSDNQTLFDAVEPINGLKYLVNNYVESSELVYDFGTGSAITVASSTGSSYQYWITSISDAFIPEYDGFVQVDASVTLSLSGSGNNTAENVSVMVVSDIGGNFKDGAGTSYKFANLDAATNLFGYNFLSKVVSPHSFYVSGSSNTKTGYVSGSLRVQRGTPVYLIVKTNCYGSGVSITGTRNYFTIKGTLNEVI